MPINLPTNLPSPADSLESLRTPNNSSFITNYMNGGGTVTNSYGGDHSHYDPMPLHNNISAPGKITINVHDVTALANSNPEWDFWQPAYLSILLHELGHAFYATRVGSDYTSDPAKMMEWCFNREALASLFVFNTITELGHYPDGGLIVPGPGLPIDLYDAMAKEVQGINPASFEYERKLLAYARSKYSANKKYRDMCTKWVNGGGLPPQYLPPAVPGGGGSGGSVPMPLPYIKDKIPGGYWQEVPPKHPSD